MVNLVLKLQSRISKDYSDYLICNLRDVLLEGGTAVDAAIAGMFCNGVYSSQSMGIGGGFLMTIYHAENQTASTLDARETAPASSTKDMFKADPDASQHGPKSRERARSHPDCYGWAG